MILKNEYFFLSLQKTLSYKNKIALTLKKAFIMNNKMRCKILLNVIKRLYEQHPDMREIIDSSKVDVCREENISPD